MADNENGLLEMTVGIVANYVSNNRVTPDELAGLISSVHGALGNVGEPAEEVSVMPDRLTPAAIRKLVTPEGITSLIDGRKFKSMRRHLSLQGYTPESYREHFGLPKDFPMVSPDYAKARSDMAKAMGLGSGGRQPKKGAKPARKPRAAKA